MVSKDSIEQSLTKLETIISKFEKGGIAIDEGIRDYETAAKLIGKIRKELESKELKIKTIKSNI